MQEVGLFFFSKKKSSLSWLTFFNGSDLKTWDVNVKQKAIEIAQGTHTILL